MNLPPKLRVEVYRQLEVVGKIFYTPDWYEIQEGVRFKERDTTPPPSLSILRVSKTIHKETEDVYMSQNVFVLSLCGTRCYHSPNLQPIHPNESASCSPAPRSKKLKHVNIALCTCANTAVDVVRKCGTFPVDAWARLPLLPAFTSLSRLASFTVLLSYDLFHQPYLSIFRVSKAIQQEAEHLYFSANTFVLPSKWHFMSFFGEGAPRRILFSKTAVKKIKHIELMLCARSIDYPLAMCRSDWTMRSKSRIRRTTREHPLKGWSWLTQKLTDGC